MDEKFVGYRLEEDQPSALLVLRWCGPAPHRWRRWVPLTVLLLVLGIGGAVFWQVWAPTIQKALGQGALGGDELVPLFFVLLISGMMGIQLLSLWWQHGRDEGFWRELAWDARDGVFRGRFVGDPLIGRSGTTIPLSEISHLDLQVGAEGEETIPLDLRMNFRSNRPALDFSLDVQHVDRRVEALDLLFRLARVVGLSSFVIYRNTAQRLDVTVLPAPSGKWQQAHDQIRAGEEHEDDEEERDDLADELDDGRYPVGPDVDVVPIPEDRSLANYQARLAAPTGFEEPTTAVAKFAPQKLAGDVENTKLTTWDPGGEVRFHRAGWPTAGRVALPLIGGAAIGLACAFPLEFLVRLAFLPHPPARWLTFVAATVVGGLALLWYLWPLMTEREVVFDWGRRVVRFREGSRGEERSLADIEELTLGGIHTSRSTWNGRRMTYTTNPARGQLRMVLADRDVAVIDTDFPGTNWEAATQKLLPLTVALARALNIPWRLVDARGGRRPPGWYGLKRGQAIALTVGGLLVLTVIAWHSWVTFDTERRIQQAQEELTRRGVSVERVAAREVRARYRLKNVWRVEFPAGCDDAQWTAILEHLRPLPRLDLNLHGTQITDSSLPSLVTLKNLAALDLSATAVTDAGLESLFHVNYVEVLDLSDTVAGERGVSTAAMIYKLKVLLLDHTRANDNGFENLRIRSDLEFVSAVGTSVTAKGAESLRNALPSVVIEGVADRP